MGGADGTAGGRTITTRIPARLDRLPWSRWRRAVLGFSLFIGQAFLYNAITFGFGAILTTFFDVPTGDTGYRDSFAVLRPSGRG